MSEKGINPSGRPSDPPARQTRLGKPRSSEIGGALRRAFSERTTGDRTDRELRNLLKQLC